MFSKIIFLALLGLLLFVIWQKKRVLRIKQEELKNRMPKSEKMVQCPVCGVHFVEVDGVWVNGIMYCSQECADKAQESKL